MTSNAAKTIRDIRTHNFTNRRRIVTARIVCGSLPPLHVELMIVGSEVEGSRFLDVSGGEYFPCYWLSDEQRGDLAQDIMAASTRRRRG